MCVIRTSPITISQLLYELRASFRSEAFQSKYKDLKAEARAGGEGHVRMVEHTFEVQCRVIPRYGFEANPPGVRAMRAESGVHADGLGLGMTGQGCKLTAKLRRDIHVCLDMETIKGRAASMRMPLFHTVGDSHSKFGWPPCVIQHWQGPLLCYNVDRVDLRKVEPPIHEGDAVCLCFGEIDCRCHVWKHCVERAGDKGKPYQEFIDGIIEKYFAHLRAQVKLLPQGVKIFVYNVPPPVRRCEAEENPQFPYLGEDEERQNYVLYFNKRLFAECRRAGFRYFDVYDSYADKDGFLKTEYSDGQVHISDGVWIDEVIKGLALKPSYISELNFVS